MPPINPSDISKKRRDHDARKLRVLGVFSGIGGIEHGLERSGGFEIAAVCEIDESCHPILRERFPNARIYNDVRALSAAQLRADGIDRIDAVCGGFPCQDASIANIGGLGTSGPRTGLYVEPIRLARELEAEVILLENVPELLNRGFGDVLGALAENGFDAEWDSISARDAGAAHERERLWIVAYPERSGRKGSEPDHGILGRARQTLALDGDKAFAPWRALVGGEHVLRGRDGVRVGVERKRLHQLGNAVCPQIPQSIGRAILQARAAA